MNVAGLNGLVAILPTPFTDDGKIDENGLKRLVRAAIDRQLDGVAVLGSNAEFPYLRFEEKIQVMEIAVSAANGEIPVIGTASAWSTEQAIDLAKEAKAAGCDALMAALPVYFNLDLKSVVHHFKSLAKATDLPVYYYHFPDVTGLKIRPKDLARIAEIDGIIGTKLTVMNRPFLKKTIEATRRYDWKVFTGASLLLYDCLEFGGAGVFCPIPLVGTEDVRMLWDAFSSGDHTKAKQIQKKLLKTIPLFTGSSLPPAILALGFQVMVRLSFLSGNRPFATHGLLKETLRAQGYLANNKVRRPNLEVSETEQKLVEKTLASLGWL
jgi:4-hydroxy-tetrahydrodipicolinate synthase